MDVFVGRQPIFTGDKKIFGYELLFRSGQYNAFPDYDGDTATSQVLANTFLAKSKDTILPGVPGFINFTRNLICDQVPMVFPKNQLFIEVLENIEPDPEVIDALQQLKKNGYRIVLDDFTYNNKSQLFIEICDIVKFDLLATPLDTIEPTIKEILKMGHITLLAEKVESHEVFLQAKKMGFKLFQGYFFAKPEIITEKGLTTNQVSKLRLISEIRRSDPDLAKIRDLIKLDVALSFKLLKLTNSAYFRRLSSINTIKEAMLVIGLENLKKFINLAVLGDLGLGKPNELIRLSIIRASLCEQLGQMISTEFNSEELFTIGLFSLMDAMLDISMKDFVNQLAFSEKMVRALTNQDDKIREIFQVILFCERMDQYKFDEFPESFQGKDLASVLPSFYFHALKIAAFSESSIM